MKTLIRTCSLIAVSFLVSGSKDCHAQFSTKEDTQYSEATKPDIRIEVNKTHDEHGNLLSYDSVYTYRYAHSSEGGLGLNMDSIFMQMHPPFFKAYPHLFNAYEDSARVDSLELDYLFPSADPFENYWIDMFKMEDMFPSLDSIQNLFFQNNYPRIWEMIPFPE